MANEVKILFSAIDKVTATTNKIQAELKQTGQAGSTSFASMSKNALAAVGGVAAIGAAVGTAAKFVQGSIDDWANYNEEIRKLSIATGAAPDQFSRLIQAADDAGVSIGAMETSLRLASRQMPISVQSIAALSDELRGMENTTERNARMQKLFGRGWAEIVPFLLSGSEAIEAGTAAIADNLIVTDESIRKARAYKISVDNLADAWTGVKNTVGNEAMPVLTGLLSNLNENITANVEYYSASKLVTQAVKAQQQALQDYNGTLTQSGDWIEENTEFQRQKQAIEQQGEDILAKLISGEMKYADVVAYANKKLQEAQDAYTGTGYAAVEYIRSQQGAATAAQELGDEQDELNEKVAAADKIYSTASSALRDYTENTRLQAEAQQALDLAMGRVTPQQIQMNLLIERAAKLLNEGAISVENWTEIINGFATGTLDAAGAVQLLNGYLKNLPKETRLKIYIETYGTQVGENKGKQKASGEEKAEQILNPPGGATGLSMIVPPGYPNDSFYVRASSGEQVDILTKSQQRTSRMINDTAWSAASGKVSSNDVYISVGGISIIAQRGQSPTAIAQAVVAQLNTAMKSARRSGLGYTG